MLSLCWARAGFVTPNFCTLSENPQEGTRKQIPPAVYALRKPLHAQCSPRPWEQQSLRALARPPAARTAHEITWLSMDRGGLDRVLKPSGGNPQYRLPVSYAEPHPDLHQLQSQEPVLWKLLHCSSPALQGRHRSLLLFLVQRTWQWDGDQWERARPALSLPSSQAAQGQAAYQGHPLDAFKVIKALLKQQPITTTIIYTT